MATNSTNRSQPRLDIIWLGDVSLNDEYNTLSAKGLNPFTAVEGILASADLVVANLECFVRGDHGINPLREYGLSADLATLDYLTTLNLGLVGLANNHAYDNLDDGFDKTIRRLDQLGISHIGASLVGEETKPFIFEKNGIRIGILNYVTHDTNPRKPESSRIKLNWFDLNTACSEIRNLKKLTDQVVVYPHWGGVMEGSMYPEPKLFQIAHRLIDAGADLIVGHHSHTLQPFEIYNGKHIFYSLGNFCFSNVNKDGVISQLDSQRSRRSAILKVAFDKVSYTLSFQGINNLNNFIVPDQDNSSPAIQDLTGRGVWLKFPITWALYFFYEKNLYKIIRYFFAPGRNPVSQMKTIKPYMLRKTLTNFLRTFKILK
ncbi:MAG TPA: CapA family protein [Candidatus Cloacimonadota bacterium]|nr:CapA family protein [Candidatus Cloacimonadota bacterium]